MSSNNVNNSGNSGNSNSNSNNPASSSTTTTATVTGPVHSLFHRFLQSQSQSAAAQSQGVSVTPRRSSGSSASNGASASAGFRNALLPGPNNASLLIASANNSSNGNNNYIAASTNRSNLRGASTNTSSSGPSATRAMINSGSSTGAASNATSSQQQQMQMQMQMQMHLQQQQLQYQQLQQQQQRSNPSNSNNSLILHSSRSSRPSASAPASNVNNNNGNSAAPAAVSSFSPLSQHFSQQFQHAYNLYSHQQAQAAQHFHQPSIRMSSASNHQNNNNHASVHPHFRAKVVCQLTCRFCTKLVCKRGMKAILLADANVELFSTDSPPKGVQLVEEDYTTANCRCKIRDLACLTCGNVIGYHVTQPCDTCLESCNNGHFWMFLSDSVASRDRLDQTGDRAMLWAHLPYSEHDTDFIDPYDFGCR